jgi:flagellar hook assembly protein FlgD
VEFEEVVGAYPNPFNPEAGSTRLMFSLSRGGEVTARVYSVSGRLVRQETIPGAPGQNAFIWDGRDAAHDPVANGVYLVQLTTRGEEDGDTRRHLERVVVLR